MRFAFPRYMCSKFTHLFLVLHSIRQVTEGCFTCSVLSKTLFTHCIAPIAPLFNHRAVHLASLYPHFSILKFQLIVVIASFLLCISTANIEKLGWWSHWVQVVQTMWLHAIYWLYITLRKWTIFVWSYHQLIKLHRASLPQMLTIKMFTLPCLSSASLCHFLICSRI